MFQSTHPRRVRRDMCDGRSCYLRFQSTHPRRVRLPLTSLIRLSYDSFNPRTHVGCDKYSYWLCTSLCSFNPRTHVGCDVTERL